MPGIALVALGLWVITGWFLRSAMMVQIVPGLVAMVFNTAVCFLLCGVALLLLRSKNPRTQRVPSILGACVVLLASLIFLENVAEGLHLNELMLDWPGLHSWLIDGNSHAGRMAPNTALGFMLAGLVLIVETSFRRSGTARLAIVASFVVLTLGITGLIGYTLNLGALYSWFKGSQMAIHTASGMVVLGIGLLAKSLKLSSRDKTLSADARISLIGALIVLTASVSTGLAGFVTMQVSAKTELTRGLTNSLNGRLLLVESSLREGRERSMLLAASVAVTRELKAALDSPSAAAREPLKTLLLRSATAARLESVTLDTPDGRRLVEIGSPPSPNDFALEVRGADSQIIWAKKFSLRSTVPLQDETGQVIARMKIVRDLPMLEALMMSSSGYGLTGEAGLCQLHENGVRCLPQFRQPKPYYTPYVTTGVKSTPMALALSGKRGIFSGDDYRKHNVLAAYAPLGETGLAMVLKQDSWEIFQPIAEQLQRVIPIFLLLTAAGMWLLRSQVKPLATRLVQSEAQAREANRAMADEEQRVRAVLDNIGDGIITMDGAGMIRSVNPAACKIFGYVPEEVLGFEVEMLMPPELRDRHRESMARYLQHGITRIVNQGTVELNGMHKDGSQFPIELSITHINDHDSALFVGIVRDISERAQAQQALHDEKERLRVTLHSIGDAVITTDTQGLVRYLNPVAQVMTGWNKEDALGRNIEEVFHIIHDVTGERAQCPVDVVLATGDITGLADHTELVTKEGRHIAIEDSAAPIRGQDGAVSGVVIVFHDVTQQRRLAEQISYQASHDALTDLVNRREFERRLTLALQKEDSTPSLTSKGLALMYLDLDQFKLVNDTCGHVAGDQLLIQIANLVRTRLRSEDTLARLGGDEFAILLENCPPEVALRVAESIRQCIRDLQFTWEDKSFTVGVSIGLVSRDGDQSFADLLKSADSACYVAKEKGRNLVHVYRSADADLIRRSGEMGWVARIEGALRDDRFELYMQPIAPLTWKAGDAHLHYEILVRMRDEEGVLVPPMAFIPAAERYGLMPRVDRWIVGHALDLLEARSPSGPQFGLSINLSATSINQADFLPFLCEQLSTRNIRTSDVCFEITETAAIASLTQSSRMMHELKALGCRFSLDDFGSGMSSFSYLKHLPVDYVKIDGSFVKDIEEDLVDRAMVAAINNIAHVMGIYTVAEFVENDDIIKRLSTIGVDFVQGYAIGRPVPASELNAPRPVAV
ncbi:MAG: hypothetical protein JWL63_2177 [Rhodocyclales bacterium]|nr:hypothetical protein [Rhodocyclales bacterium]